MVTPARLAPGMSASICANPIISALRSDIVCTSPPSYTLMSDDRVACLRSASQSGIVKTMLAQATISGLRNASVTPSTTSVAPASSTGRRAITNTRTRCCAGALGLADNVARADQHQPDIAVEISHHRQQCAGVQGHISQTVIGKAVSPCTSCKCPEELTGINSVMP